MKFSASHRLHSPALSDEENRRVYGVCNNPHGHGHNYLLEVTLRGDPARSTGMIMNLDDLGRILQERIVLHVDHKHLNHDVPWLAEVVPTVENLVRIFWSALEAALPPGVLHEVRLQETDTSWATYRGERA